MRMRALFAAAVVMLGLAGTMPARAADLVEPGAEVSDIDGGQMPYGAHSVRGVRARPVQKRLPVRVGRKKSRRA